VLASNQERGLSSESWTEMFLRVWETDIVMLLHMISYVLSRCSNFWAQDSKSVPEIQESPMSPTIKEPRSPLPFKRSPLVKSLDALPGTFMGADADGNLNEVGLCACCQAFGEDLYRPFGLEVFETPKHLNNSIKADWACRRFRQGFVPESCRDQVIFFGRKRFPCNFEPCT
jgi:hypothetical protein